MAARPLSTGAGRENRHEKIPCLFQRDFAAGALASRAVAPGCEWVRAGEGVATRKRDGTSCAVISGVLHLRFDAKHGRAPPPGALPCQAPDPVTGHWPHWLAVGDRPEGKWHREAWAALARPLADGTYELCGPRVGGNAEQLKSHVFFRHGSEVLDVPGDFDGLRTLLSRSSMEGLVFHRGDAAQSMVKLRRVDFGFAWGPKPSVVAPEPGMNVSGRAPQR